MMWNWRMLAATGEAKYADGYRARALQRHQFRHVPERHAILLSHPLAFDPSGGDKIRNEWYDTTCCPPNLERTLASLPGYFYSTSDDGVYVHLYDNSQLDWHLENGTLLKVRQKNQLSLGWRRGDCRVTRATHRIHSLRTHPRMEVTPRKSPLTAKWFPARLRVSTCRFRRNLVSGRRGHSAIQYGAANP